MLNDDNYFSPEMSMKYMGVSQFKAFEKCQAGALAELKGEYQRDGTKALLVGSYVDAYFEGSIGKFKKNHPDIFKHDGTLKVEYQQADKIISRIKKDKLFTKFMSGEKQRIYTGEIEGVPVKIKVDSMHPNMIVDLKVMRDFEPMYVPEQGRLPWYEAWRYDLQGAVYQEIVRQNIGEKLPFFLAAATKEKVTDIEIIQIGQDLLDFELANFKQKVSYYDAIKCGVIEPERCEHCDYCKQTKILTEPLRTEDFINE